MWKHNALEPTHEGTFGMPHRYRLASMTDQPHLELSIIASRRSCPASPGGASRNMDTLRSLESPPNKPLLCPGGASRRNDCPYSGFCAVRRRDCATSVWTLPLR